MTQMIENDLYVLVAILLRSLRSESQREKIIMQEFILSESHKHPDWWVQGPNHDWKVPNSKKRPGAGNIFHCDQTVTHSSDWFSKIISTPVQHSWVRLCANLINWSFLCSLVIIKLFFFWWWWSCLTETTGHKTTRSSGSMISTMNSY